MGLDLTLQFLLEPGLWRVLLGHVPTGSVLIPMAFLPGLQWEGPEDRAAPNTLLRELTTWDDQPRPLWRLSSSNLGFQVPVQGMSRLLCCGLRRIGRLLSLP